MDLFKRPQPGPRMNESDDAVIDPDGIAESEQVDSSTKEPGFAERLQTSLDKLDPLRRLEAVLFLAREPLHSRKLSQLAGLEDGTQARSLVKRLNVEYDETGRAFLVKQVAGGFQIRTRPMFSDWLRKTRSTPASVRLSGPAMETLSVIAYRQPVLKAEIEAIRGVSCGELLRQLLDRGLVKIAGRSTELGNPFQYGTTRRFLEVFGLANIDALPRGEKLRGKGLPNWSIVINNQPENAEENPVNSDANLLDESEPNSQNTVDPNTTQLEPDEPDQE